MSALLSQLTLTVCFSTFSISKTNAYTIGHMTTDAVSTALLSAIAEKAGSVLQVFQIRNDSRSGGTVGPMLSAATGMRAIDAGVPQLSMHSIRATVGNLDPGLGVKLFKGVFDYYEEVDEEFRTTV
jgi:aminopeptidase I